MICRLCLDNLHQATSVPLFSQSTENQEDGVDSAVKMIKKHLMLELTPEDNISTSICQNCYDHLEEFHQFWLLIEKKQKTLQYEFLAVKCEEPIAEDGEIANESLIQLPPAEDEISSIDLKLEKLDDENCLASIGILDKEVSAAEALSSLLDCDVQDEKKNAADADASSDDEIPLVVYRNPAGRKKLKRENGLVRLKSRRKLMKSTESDQWSGADSGEMNEKLDLSCDLCKENVGDFDNLIEHFSTKHPKIKAFIKCCRRTFTQKSRLLKHLHFHRNPDEYRCDICKKIFSSKKYLSTHKTMRHEDEDAHNLHCKVCDKSFNTRKRYNYHRQMHENGENSTCQFCGKAFTSKFRLRRHIQGTHDHVYPYKCTACLEPFNFKADLDRHYDNCKNKSLLIRLETRPIPLEKKDNIVEEHICKICHKIFCNPQRLRRHIESIHENIHPYVCDQCGKKFKFKPAFEKHLLEHSGIVEPPAQCSICGNWLKNKHSLRLHLYAHDGGTNKCHLCERVCPSRRALRGHIKNVHREEKHFKCKYCEKSFKNAKNLEEHIATHTGAQLYSCPHCSKETRSSSNMYVHIKRMHTEEWIKSKLARSNNPDVNVSQNKSDEN